MSEHNGPEEQPAAAGRSHSLGEMLRAAREAQERSLDELSRATAVRRDYLAALEEDRHGDLPEPVYVRNFIRLYARELGLDAAAALAMYGSAAQGAPAAAPAVTATPARTPQPSAPDSPRPAASIGGGARRPFRPGAWLPTVLLVGAVVALAVWGFNSTMFRPDRPVTAGGSPAGGTAAPVAAPEETEEETSARTVRLSVSTEPEGARVLVDAFPVAGLTPVEGALVTARDNRLIRIELEGYEPFEAPFDLTFDRNLSFVLAEAAEPAPAPETEADAEEVAATSGPGTIAVSVTDVSWLEIYPGTERSGTPHVYTTAQAGDSWTFSLPVTIRAGNAAGVNVSVGGRDLGPLGSAGEIAMETFTADN